MWEEQKTVQLPGLKEILKVVMVFLYNCIYQYPCPYNIPPNEEI